MKKRVLSIALTLVMVIGMLPMTAAAEGSDGCSHHTMHTTECGYVVGSEGSPCTQGHGDGEHTDDCGYAPAVEAVPCNFECPECAAKAAAGEIQALINALPDKSYVTAETASEVEGKLNAVDQAKSAFINTWPDHISLLDELDYTRYADPISALEALAGQAGAGTPEASTVGDYIEIPNSGLKFKILTEDAASAEGTVELVANEYTGISYDLPKLVYHNSIYYTVTSIGEAAFSKCANLASITIPHSVTYFGPYAFYMCTNLANVTLSDKTTSIGSYAFEDCTNLTSITIPDSVTTMGKYVFQDCSNLASVTLSNGLTDIDTGVFERCTSLTSITIPANVTNIGMDAFKGCSSLQTAVLLTDAEKTVNGSAFEDTNANVIHKYVAPGNLRFDGTTVRWEALKTDYVSYKVEVSQVATSAEEIVQSSKTYDSDGSSSCDLSDYMTKSGTYRVRLTAVRPLLITQGKPDYQGSDTVEITTKYSNQLEISDVQATRTGANTAEVSFTASKAGTMYYMVSAMAYVGDPNIDTTGNGIAVSQGTNTFHPPLVSGAEPTQPQFLYVTFKTADGVVSNITCITIPAYSGTTYQLTVTAGAGGSVSPGNHYIEAGESAVFTITPDSGYALDMLTLDGTDVTSAVSNNQYTIDNVQAAHTIAATFQLIPVPTTYTVSLSADPTAGGTVSGDGTYDENTTVTVEATPHTGYQFVRWTENGSEVSTSASYSFQATADRSLVAVFETETQPPAPTSHSITVQTEGSGTAAASVATAVPGTQITLTAVPAGGWQFKEWVAVSGNVVISGNAFSMPAADVVIKAVFQEAASTTTATTAAVTADTWDNYDTDSPKTGDTTNNSLWLALAVAGLLGLTGTAVWKRRILK